MESHSLSIKFSHFVKFTILSQLKIIIIFILIIAILKLDLEEAGLQFLGMLLNTNCRFYLQFLYLSDKHVLMIYSFLQMACICHKKILSCPEPPMGISGVGSFPVWSGGSLIFSSSFRSSKLPLHRLNHLH